MMMSVVGVVSGYHVLLWWLYYFVFRIFSFLWVLVAGYGRYMIFFSLQFL